MASAIIHMAVANEINKVTKRDNDRVLISSITPDISKHIGESKIGSHFLDSDDNSIPNINKFLDKYDMNLQIFYNEPPEFENIIQEIPMDKIKLIIDKMSTIIENSKVHKDFIFDIENIKKFISISVELILAELKELEI